MAILLSEQDVRAVLSIDDLIGAMESALAQFSSGGATQPPRTMFQVGERRALFAVMPAYVANPPAMGSKLVTVFSSNGEIGLPTHLASIMLFNPSTGELQALIDGRFITEARTAAVSAVSTKLLARHDAGVLAIIGSGVQARSHVEALSRVRNLRELRVWSPNRERRERFGTEMQAHVPVAIDVRNCAAEAVAGADLIVLATSVREPVVRSEWIADGAHICAVGAFRPDQREMDTALVARGKVFVDSRAGALAEAGDILMPIKEGAFDAARIAGELGEVVSGAVPGRTTPTEVTIFKSLGMAVEDVAAAQLAYTRATKHRLGREFVL